MMKDAVRSVVGTGLSHALGVVAAEARARVVHRVGVFKARRLALTEPVMLNCGCGPYQKPGWINIDMTPGSDARLDLRERLPFPDDCASFVYSEHFFEHLLHPRDTRTFLRESLRVLIPGGRFRLGVPDTERALRAYVLGDPSYWEEVERSHPADCDTRLHHINYHFRQNLDHKYAWDYDTLRSELRKAGFVSILESKFDPELDQEHRRIGTLYMEAVKRPVGLDQAGV